MTRLIVLAFAVLLGTSLGCGSGGVDSSSAAPATTPEQDMKTLENAAESGKMDPSTYGKQ